MRILYLCHRIPYPPDKGDKIRAFHQIRALGAKHELDLFTLVDDPADLVHQAELARYCRQVTVTSVNPPVARLKALPFLFTAKPMTLPYFYSAKLAAAVRNALLIRSYDRIFVYCSAMAQYVKSAGDIPIIMDFVDVDSDKWMQYAGTSRFPFSAVYRREGRCLREYERRICERAACAVVSTEREATLLREIAPTATIHAIPNGVDAEYFNPAVVPPQRTLPTIIFTGDMGYFPNQKASTYFARQVFPLIRQSIKDARFVIVGRNPNREVHQLQEIQGVEVTGFVPDVRAYLAKAHVAVAPFQIAAGIQNKILEAMSYGLPVVATTRAMQGLTTRVAELVESADAADEFAARVAALLSNPASANALGARGRQRVMGEYDWDSALRKSLYLVENPGHFRRQAATMPQAGGN